ADAQAMTVPPELALHIVLQVLRALSYAHGMKREGESLEVVHRDVSPQNILVSEHGEVKLTDFGIAKAKHRSENTVEGTVKGKVSFMSPEQAQARPLDSRSDLYSLGTVLYLLVTGKLPYEAPTTVELLVRIQSGEFRPPLEVNPALNPEL